MVIASGITLACEEGFCERISRAYPESFSAARIPMISAQTLATLAIMTIMAMSGQSPIIQYAANRWPV